MDLSDLPGWLTVAVMAAYIALVLTAVIFAILSRNWSIFQSLLWVVVILVVPLLGSVLFFVVDAKFGRQRQALEDAEADVEATHDVRSETPS